MTRANPLRDEFHRLLGRLVHATSRLDFNVGIQLDALGSYCGADVADLLRPQQARLGERLKKLKELVLDVYSNAGDEARKELIAWFERADDARALRNDYAHGRWGVPGKLAFKPGGRAIDAEPLLVFVPLSWNFEPDRPDESTSMSMREFEAQVAIVESLLSDYERLTKMYASLAKPRSSEPPLAR